MADSRRVVFAGTPDFARAVLERLLGGPEVVVGVITQPDRPSGRGRKLQASPVKQVAESARIPLIQPQSARDPETLAWLRDLRPDLLVVVAYGQILPQSLLEVPRLGAVNVHASLLPLWRGAAPIARSLAAGDAETGICIMQMEAGLDCGPVLWRRRTPILSVDTAGSLHDRLAGLGAEALREALDRLWEGALVPEPQEHALATYAMKLSKDEARMDWRRPAESAGRLVRAYNPYPVAHTQFREQPLRIWEARVDRRCGDPGTMVALDPEGPVVACGEGSLVLLLVQPAGKAKITGSEFLRGYRPTVGETFG